MKKLSNKVIVAITAALVVFNINAVATTDDTSLSLGTSANANSNSVAIGISSGAAFGSVAVGNTARSDTQNGVAVGYGSNGGPSSVSVGYNSRTTSYGTSIGYNSSAYVYSTSIGYNASASGMYSIALGYNTTASLSNQFVIGSFNAVASNYTNSSGIAESAQFVIGNGTSSTSLSNSLVVYSKGSAKVPGDLVVGGKIIGSGGNLYSPAKIGIHVSSIDSDAYLDVGGGISLGNGGGKWIPVDTAYESSGNFIKFSDPGISEDFIGYKGNTFYFADSLGGGDAAQPSVVVLGNIYAKGLYTNAGQFFVVESSNGPRLTLSVSGSIRNWSIDNSGGWFRVFSDNVTPTISGFSIHEVSGKSEMRIEADVVKISKPQGDISMGAFTSD